MNTSLSNALSGLDASARRIQTAATNIANASSVPAVRETPKAHGVNNAAVAAPNVDIATELVDSSVAALSYKANAAVIKTVKETDQYLMDILA
jgi:flagellar basal body rod protein FlgC